jgi:hypothetical protein
MAPNFPGHELRTKLRPLKVKYANFLNNIKEKCQAPSHYCINRKDVSRTHQVRMTNYTTNLFIPHLKQRRKA